jgi:hypothetical protein
MELKRQVDRRTGGRVDSQQKAPESSAVTVGRLLHYPSTCPPVHLSAH